MTDPNVALRQFKKNLNILQEREAKWANTPPLELLNQIEDHRRAIALTEQLVADEMSEAEWREALQRLLVDLRLPTGQPATVTIDMSDKIAQHLIPAV